MWHLPISWWLALNLFVHLLFQAQCAAHSPCIISYNSKTNPRFCRLTPLSMATNVAKRHHRKLNMMCFNESHCNYIWFCVHVFPQARTEYWHFFQLQICCNRGFPKVDHSGIDARIVLEQINSAKNLLTGLEPSTLGMSVLITSCLSCLTPVLDPNAGSLLVSYALPMC